MKLPSVPLFAFLLLPVLAPAADPPVDPPAEIGTVAWNRDFDAALELAGKEGKPVLILFQEVPG